MTSLGRHRALLLQVAGSLWHCTLQFKLLRMSRTGVLLIGKKSVVWYCCFGDACLLPDDLHVLHTETVRAEAIVQILALGEAESKAYAITSKEGDGPGTDPAKWKALLA